MKKILFATDFSDDTSTAFDFAILLAFKSRAELVIIHTYTPPYIDAATPITMVASMQLQMIDAFEQQLKKMVNTASAIGVKTSSELRMSDVVSGIKETIEEKHIDYLVVGKTGSTGFLTKVLGSNTAAIIQKISTPTFVVPKIADGLNEIEHVLHGTQLEFDEQQQLKTTFEVAAIFGADVTIVHVKAKNEMDIHNDKIFIQDIDQNFNHEVHIIQANTVHGGMNEAIRSFKSDLLVVASHSRSFFSQLLNPSKSQKLADTVNIPTLVLHFGKDE